MEKKEEARENKEVGTKKAKSLLNYPEVQKAFVDLARSQATVKVLEERNEDLEKNLQDAREESENALEELRQELGTKETEIVRLNSVLTEKDGELETAERKRKTAESDHREKDRLVKEKDEALKLVEERPVVEKVVEHYFNDYSASLVFFIGLVLGLGIGAAVMYFLPSLV